MSLKTFVKVSRVSNLSDARYCAGMMVDMMGFNLDEEDPDFVDVREFQEITEWIAGVKLVGEFESSDINTIKLKSQDYQVDYLEVSHPDILEEIKELNIPLIFKINIKNEDHLTKFPELISYISDFVEYIIIDCNEQALFSQLEEIITKEKTSISLIKAFDISEKSVKSLSRSWSGIQLVGTREDQPGFKDYGMVMDILEVLEED